MNLTTDEKDVIFLEDLNENLDLDALLDSIEENVSKEENIPELEQD